MQSKTDPNHRWTIARWLAIAQLLAIAGLFFLVRLDAEKTAGWMPQCILYQTTGLHCPGCGATRSARQLANGHVLAAIRYNPFFFFVGLPWGVFYTAHLLRMAFTGKPLTFPYRFPILVTALTVFVIAFFVLRNIPHEAFDILRPPA